MTTEEIQNQREHDETMRNLRKEFATKVWPQIAREVGHSAVLPPVHHAAWIAFRAGRRHAANTLPELVEAARDFYNEADSTSAAADRLHDALAKAEEVNA